MSERARERIGQKTHVQVLPAYCGRIMQLSARHNTGQISSPHTFYDRAPRYLSFDMHNLPAYAY